ncbi:hypothetical protein JHK87_027561 [Glycine soja]|nr:hypothetical protein JHK87_027561 [Glycine soja]
MTSSKKSNLLFLMNNVNHKNMNEYVDNRQEIGNLPDMELVDTDDINWIIFECPSNPKVITISEDMSFDALRKTIFDANRDEILTLVHKPRKPRMPDEIIDLMCDESM